MVRRRPSGARQPLFGPEHAVVLSRLREAALLAQDPNEKITRNEATEYVFQALRLAGYLNGILDTFRMVVLRSEDPRGGAGGHLPRRDQPSLALALEAPPAPASAAVKGGSSRPPGRRRP